MRKPLPNPPKSNKLTKKVAVEAMRLLDMLEYDVAMNGWAAPSREWLWDFHDRLCACRANLHAWHDADLAKRRKKNLKQPRVKHGL